MSVRAPKYLIDHMDKAVNGGIRLNKQDAASTLNWLVTVMAQNTGDRVELTVDEIHLIVMSLQGAITS